MDQKINMLVSMINELKLDFRTFCEENRQCHEEIIGRQDKTNGSIALLKKNQLILRGVAVGVIATLLVLGFMPDRLYQLIKTVF